MSGVFGGQGAGGRAIASIPTTQVGSVVSATTAKTLALSVSVQPSFRSDGLFCNLTTPRILNITNPTASPHAAVIDCEINNISFFSCTVNNIPPVSSAWDFTLDSPVTVLAPSFIYSDTVIIGVGEEDKSVLDMSIINQYAPIRLSSSSVSISSIDVAVINFYITLSDPALSAAGGFLNIFNYTRSYDS